MLIRFQSTHPLGVRLFAAAFSASVVCVSIHAPTRGATNVINQFKKAIKVSIHAPTRGATDSAVCGVIKLLSFNPRTHSGCDLSLCVYMHIAYSFNPRTHSGCDFDRSKRPSGLLFQSTHPLGVRLEIEFCWVQGDRFQSTHPLGVRRFNG